MSHAKEFGWIVLALAMVATQGCASRDRWLDCEFQLEPINAPAPVAHEAEAENADSKSHAERPR